MTDFHGASLWVGRKFSSHVMLKNGIVGSTIAHPPLNIYLFKSTRLQISLMKYFVSKFFFLKM